MIGSGYPQSKSAAQRADTRIAPLVTTDKRFSEALGAQMDVGQVVGSDRYATMIVRSRLSTITGE